MSPSGFLFSFYSSPAFGVYHCKCIFRRTDAAAVANVASAARGQSLLPFHVLTAVWLILEMCALESETGQRWGQLHKPEAGKRNDENQQTFRTDLLFQCKCLWVSTLCHIRGKYIIHISKLVGSRTHMKQAFKLPCFGRFIISQWYGRRGGTNLLYLIRCHNTFEISFPLIVITSTVSG